ncbi:hypothetical protein ACWDUE_13970 [Streptomyces albogriseolus]
MASHDMTTPGAGSNSHLNSARMQQGSPENADRLLAERRAGSRAVSHSDSLADHYAERAAQREAERQEAEEWQAEQKAEAERRKRAETGERWDAASGHTVDLGSTVADQVTAARQSLDEFTQRAEGEELAAQIIAGQFRPWTR